MHSKRYDRYSECLVSFQFSDLSCPQSTTSFHNTTDDISLRAILHDARTYPKPEVFDPDRFMNPTTPDSEKSAQPDPCKFSFGFGARACPGRQFAEKSLLLSMVGVLSGCNIEAAKGMSVDNIQFTTGHTR